MTEEPRYSLREAQRKLAAQYFNETWDLLEKPERTPEDDTRMIHATHASRCLWEAVGDASNLAIGEWQISRVYSVLQRAELAARHGQLSLDHSGEAGQRPFLMGYAHEALCRAALTSGERDAAGSELSKATAWLGAVTDEEERGLLSADLEQLRAALSG